MKNLILTFTTIISLTFSCLAQEIRQPLPKESKSENWQAYSLYYNSWHVNADINKLKEKTIDLATFNIPQVQTENFVSFLTTDNTNVLGNYYSHNLICTFYMTVENGFPVFDYGWENTSINNSPNPANLRFFFSTNSEPYNLNESNNNPSEYWFCDNGVDLVNILDFINGVTMEARFDDLEHWSNGLGQYASDTRYTLAFLNAVVHRRQVGLAFGGGRFFDVGIATMGVTGEKGNPIVTFHLENFQIYQQKSKR